MGEGGDYCRQAVLYGISNCFSVLAVLFLSHLFHIFPGTSVPCSRMVQFDPSSAKEKLGDSLALIGLAMGEDIFDPGDVARDYRCIIYELFLCVLLYYNVYRNSVIL